MGLSQRMSRLRKLLNLRLGPGAAVLPRDITKIQLDFAYKIDGGHRAGRKVWRQYFPRLKYHNPTISLVVNRTTSQEAPSIMTLSYQDGRNMTIDMKNRPESEVLKELLDKTKAVEVKPTLDEEAEFKRIAEQELLSAEDRKQTQLRKENALREEKLLAQARSAVAASNATTT